MPTYFPAPSWLAPMGSHQRACIQIPENLGAVGNHRIYIKNFQQDHKQESKYPFSLLFFKKGLPGSSTFLRSSDAERISCGLLQLHIQADDILQIQRNADDPGQESRHHADAVT